MLKFKMLLMNVLNSYYSLRKMLRSCMDSFIDCLNHVIRPNTDFLHGQCISTTNKKKSFVELMRIAALKRYTDSS